MLILIFLYLSRSHWTQIVDGASSKPADQQNQLTGLSNLPDNFVELQDYFDRSESVLDEDKDRKLEQLNEYSKECNRLMSLINEILNQLEHLKTEYDSVFNKTNEVHFNCQNVMNQHVSYLLYITIYLD